MYVDVYAEKYQNINGFKIKIIDNPEDRTAYLSFKTSTRSVYDLSMRENFIDGMITMKNIEKYLKESQIFYIENHPETKYILQSVNLVEHQTNTRSINAVKQNCLITVKRYGFESNESIEKTWNTIYSDIIGFTFDTLRDSKNFNAGVEVATMINIQIPKKDINREMYIINPNDKIEIKNIFTNETREVIAESIDSFGITGIIRIQSTLDMRLNDGIS